MPAGRARAVLCDLAAGKPALTQLMSPLGHAAADKDGRRHQNTTKMTWAAAVVAAYPEGEAAPGTDTSAAASPGAAPDANTTLSNGRKLLGGDMNINIAPCAGKLISLPLPRGDNVECTHTC